MQRTHRVQAPLHALWDLGHCPWASQIGCCNVLHRYQSVTWQFYQICQQWSPNHHWSDNHETNLKQAVRDHLLDRVGGDPHFMKARASSVTSNDPEVAPNHDISTVLIAASNHRTLCSDNFFEKPSLRCLGICAEIRNCCSCHICSELENWDYKLITNL
jgi:hypothetical protein